MTRSNLSGATGTAVPTSAARRRPGPRRIAFTGLTALIGLVLTVLSGHLLVTGWFDSADGGGRRFDDIAWGAIEGILVTAGLLAQLRRPERHVAGLRQSLLGLAGLLVGGAATAAFDPASAVVVLLVVALVGLHPARGEVFTRRGPVDGPVLAVALLVAGGSAWWAVTVVHRFAGLPRGDLHVQHQDSAGLVGLAVGVALVALLAAVDRWSRMPGVCAGVALLLVGVASLVLPGQADALPTAAAVAAVAGGVVLPALVLRRGRR